MSPNFLNGLLNIDSRSFEKVLSHERQLASSYINIDEWREAWQRLKSYQKHSTPKVNIAKKDSLTVWSSTAIALWFQRMQGKFDID